MKKIPVFTLQDIAFLSEEEIKEIARRHALEQMGASADSTEAEATVFFVKTKSGKKSFKLPPEIEVRVSKGPGRF